MKKEKTEKVEETKKKKRKPKRFWVTIKAKSHEAMLHLRDRYTLYLVRQTAKKVTENEFEVDALLDFLDIEKLVVDGYAVLIRKDLSEEWKKHEVISFSTWLRDRRRRKSKSKEREGGTK